MSVDRLQIWEQHRDIAMLALAHLLDECEDELNDEPMVVVVDDRDPVGGSIMGALTDAIDQSEEVDAIVVANQDGYSVLLLPVELVHNVTLSSNPACAEALVAEPPEGAMWAAVIAEGGMTLFHVPIEPFRSIGSA